jgi:DNA repair protein RecO (recombination protein O)
MKTVRTDGVVLHCYKLADADKIVLCYTRAHGLVRGVAHGARKTKSRFGAGLEPFTVVQLAYSEKPGRELAIFSEVEIVASYLELFRHAELAEVLARICTLMTIFSMPNDANDDLYRLLTGTLRALAKIDGAHHAAAAYFTMWLLRLCGHWPSAKCCANCATSLPAGRTQFLVGRGFFCTNCAAEIPPAVQRQSLSAASFQILQQMRANGPEEFTSMATAGAPANLALVMDVINMQLQATLADLGVSTTPALRARA